MGQLRHLRRGGEQVDGRSVLEALRIRSSSPVTAGRLNIAGDEECEGPEPLRHQNAKETEFRATVQDSHSGKRRFQLKVRGTCSWCGHKTWCGFDPCEHQGVLFRCVEELHPHPGFQCLRDHAPLGGQHHGLPDRR